MVLFSSVPIASAPLHQQLFCTFKIRFSYAVPFPHNLSRLQAHSGLNVIRVDVIKPNICPEQENRVTMSNLPSNVKSSLAQFILYQKQKPQIPKPPQNSLYVDNLQKSPKPVRKENYKY